MATANENTTAPEAPAFDDDRPTLEREDRSVNREDRPTLEREDRSVNREDRPTLERENRSVNREDLGEDQSISGEDRSMSVHDRYILEGGHQSVHARDRPMVGDRSIFRCESLPVVLGNTLLEIEN